MQHYRSANSHHIIALNEVEHRPLMLERFPHWKDRAEYWTVGDIDVLLPQVALVQYTVKLTR